MKHPEIKSLFKYYPIGKNQLNALAQGKLWYSKPARFNDPFDTRFYVDGRAYTYENELDTNKLSEAFGSDMSDAIATKSVSLRSELEQFKREIEELGILSLATSNKNLLMWSHYADEHYGMCMEFVRKEGSKLADDIETRPIHYTDNHPTLAPKALLDFDKKMSSKRRILYAKSKHWEYEEEWRHILEVGDQLYPWPAPLKAVYFGCKVEMQDINLVKKVINNSDVKYYKADLNKSTFGINFNAV